MYGLNVIVAIELDPELLTPLLSHTWNTQC